LGVSKYQVEAWVSEFRDESQNAKL